MSRRSYDSAGNLLATVDAGGHATTFGVNASGQVTAKTGPQPGEGWTFEYDVFGQLKKKTLVRGATARAGWQGASWSYQYKLDDGATVEETGPGGYATRRWYNAQHQLLREVRSDTGAARSSANTMTLDQEWNGPYLAKQEWKEGSWVSTLTRPSYDHRGRVLVAIEDFHGPEASARYTYTTRTPWAGRVADPVEESWATQTKSGSRTGRRAGDALGNPVEQAWGSYADSWIYDSAGRLKSETLSGKPPRSLVYDEGLVTSVTYASAARSETTQYVYWASGKAQTITEPDLRERRLTWDERGLLKKEEYGSSSSFDLRGYSYDAGGARASMTVGRGADETQWAYANGPRGELLSVTQPVSNGTFQYEYDERAQLAGVTPPAGSASAAQTFDHDYLGRQVSRSRGDATWTTLWSSGGGTTREPADPVTGLRRTAYRSQDGRGREAVVTWSGVPSELTGVARQYGPHDGLLGASETRSSGNVEVVYGYDDRFLVTSVSRGAEAVTYGYYASGERSWEQSPAGRTDYDYDPLHRLWHATSSRGSTEFVWEDGGARLLAVKAPGVTECRRYDARGRLQWMDGRDPGVPCDSPAAAPIVRFDYGYDERGNRRTETYVQAGGPTELTQYGYDLADRLTSVVSPSGAETTYGLLGDGSRNTVTTAPTQGGLRTTESYHYDVRGGLTGITDEANQAVATYTVDVAGHVRSETRAGRSKSFTWDAGGRLTAASVTVDGTTATSSFRYDHQGLRIRKQGPSGTTTYLWGAGELAEEVLPSGTRLRYERGAGLALAVGGETLLHDGLGSVVGRVGLGAPVIYRYDAWGSFQGTAGPTAAEASLAYAGQHWDADVGLSYAQQRWYQPEVGRFLSEDPVFGNVKDPSSLHSFAYAGANPGQYSDPNGTFKIWVHRKINEEAASNVTATCSQHYSGFASSNGMTDIMHPADSSRHCDESNILACMDRVDREIAQGATCIGQPECLRDPVQRDLQTRISICEIQKDEQRSGTCVPMSKLGDAIDSARQGIWDDAGAVDALGRATHTVQDFYSHSNFIDLWHEFAPNSKVAPTFSDVFGDDPDGKYAKFRAFAEERGIISGNFDVARDAAPEVFKFRKIPFVSRSPSPRHEEISKDEPSTDPEKNLLFEMAVDAARRETERLLRTGQVFEGRQRAPLPGGVCR